jgi:thioredoxin reductase (NADPH)
MRTSRIIIIGYGPAGMACAIQLKRMGLQPLVIEKDHPGGMLVNANRVENYPGFPGGIPGPDLVKLFVEQADSFNIESIQDEILDVNYDDGKFKVEGNSGTYKCDILVSATGTSPVVPANFPQELAEKGLIHFDITELSQVSGKTIGIIGAGDAAFDYSLTLAENGNEVVIFNRGNRIRALKALTEKVFINNHIKYLENITLKSLETLSDKRLEAIFKSASGNKKYFMDYLIFATGRKPEDSFFRESLKTNLPNLLKEHRLYLIGDIKNATCRQVSVAVGEGIKAAMEIFRHESNQ